MDRLAVCRVLRQPYFRDRGGRAGRLSTAPPGCVRKSAALAEDSFSRLGCADAAIASYRVFARLNESGDLPSRVRFQVSLPTPLAPVSFFVALTDRAVVETVYESVMISELTEIIEAIPRNELAIQWDVAVEFSILEGIMTSHLEDAEAGVVEKLLWLGDHVPEDVSLGYRLSYGDAGHQCAQILRCAQYDIVLMLKNASRGRTYTSANGL